MTRKKSEREQAQQFAMLLPVVFGILAALAYFKPFAMLRGAEVQPNVKFALGVLIAGPAVSLLALTIPPLWLRIFRLWMKLALGLSWVMTRVILTVFFYAILSPFALVMRVFGKRPLDLSWKDGKPTYWIDKPAGEFTLERYGKQY